MRVEFVALGESYRSGSKHGPRSSSPISFYGNIPSHRADIRGGSLALVVIPGQMELTSSVIRLNQSLNLKHHR
jgi:hypothetical protein